LEVQILQTINSIRRKDPRIYRPDVSWFEAGGQEEGEEGGDGGKKEKRKTYKDVVREQVLAAARDGEDAVLDDDDDADGGDGDGGERETKPMVYDAEQEAIRKEFLTAADSDEEEGEDGGEKNDGLLRVRQKGRGGQQEQDVKLEKRIEEEVNAMVQAAAGGDPKEQEADLFLQQFILGKKWVDPQDADDDDSQDEGGEAVADPVHVPAARDGHYGPLLSGEVDDEEDAAEVERMEDFESKYNFRFEQEGGAEIVSYGRHVEVRVWGVVKGWGVGLLG
jgi:protein KRI1